MATNHTAGHTFDHHDSMKYATEVRATYTEMRERCPVSHSDLHSGFDFLSRYADVRRVLDDPESYSSADGVFIPPSGMPPIPALEFDEPRHSEWRALLGGPLIPRAVRAFEPTIREIVEQLIDQFAAAGTADLVSQLAEPLPAIVIGRMVGLDGTQALEARNFGAALFASIGTDDFPQRMAEFAAYTKARLADRRAEPRNDYLTQLASGVANGITLDDTAAASLMVAYFVGGHHSTGSAIAGLIRHVLTVPGLREGIAADAKLLPRAIEESLRLTTPLQLFARTTRCPVRVGDEDLPEGRRVMLNLAAANRDPREFEDPETFDIGRSRIRHVTFGAGLHVCQGQHLARAELRIALTRLLERLPDLQIDGDIVESGLIGGKLMTHRALPVTFTPET
jgi:cytochrome P450